MGLVGLIPAAGQAKRLPQLPCSKEIFPIGIGERIVNGQIEKFPRPIISYLLEELTRAGVNKSIVITHKDKPDILRFLGDGSSYGIDLIYQVQEKLLGMPFAMDLAYPWIKQEIVLFGMPDTIFTPPNVFERILERLTTSKSDITLGLFPTKKPQKFGMVDFDSTSGNFIYTIDKPKTTTLQYMWGVACWQPHFTEFMHNYLMAHHFESELVFGTVIQAAHDDGIRVNVLPFEDGEFIDIGTPDDLIYAMSRTKSLLP